MLDLIGAITSTAVYATLAGTLGGLSSTSAWPKRIAFIAAASWGGGIVATAALGGFTPGATGPVPGPGLAFAGLLALLFGAWFAIPEFRAALLSLPLSALVAINVARIGGVMFLLLAADGRLSEPFASSAGWGDIVTGLCAIPLALLAARASSSQIATPLALWNAFGTLDLVVAITLGMLSAPGTPFRLFTDEPGTPAMGTLPWVMVPTMIVPVYLLIHLTIAAKLRESHRLGAVAAPGF